VLPLPLGDIAYSWSRTFPDPLGISNRGCSDREMLFDRNRCHEQTLVQAYEQVFVSCWILKKEVS
jgi:hypothetical protein